MFYTDGITESSGADDRQFGTRRLDSILAHSCRESPAEIVEAILRELAEFTSNAAPLDDRSLVVAHVL